MKKFEIDLTPDGEGYSALLVCRGPELSFNLGSTTAWNDRRRVAIFELEAERVRVVTMDPELVDALCGLYENAGRRLFGPTDQPALYNCAVNLCRAEMLRLFSNDPTRLHDLLKHVREEALRDGARAMRGQIRELLGVE